jgi:aryl-alcohol dehydrogenase-like predicted oxidoreductase
METRRLGTSELEITRVGFGAWAVGGGGWWGGWGSQDDRESVAAIRRALELGINWIDTAPIYGKGHSEQIVARALRGVAERPYVFTKCGLPWDGDDVIVDVRPETIRRELEDSLRRLEVEAVDLYQIHWPPADPQDRGHVESAWATLVALRDEGKARAIGVSNFDLAQLETISALEPPTSLQPPYSLLARDAEPALLPACAERCVGVIVYSPMASGLLTGAMTAERVAAFPPDDWRREDDKFKEPALLRNLAVGSRLAELARARNRSAGELAIAWTLRNPAVTGAIVGFRNVDQVEALVGAAGLALADGEAAELEALAAT